MNQGPTDPAARDFDPRVRKDRDNARQRKIVSNGSDKAARRHEVRIKKTANRTIRRKDRVLLEQSSQFIDENADAIRGLHRAKRKHWGTDNAAEHRARRRAQRPEQDGPVGPDQGPEE